MRARKGQVAVYLVMILVVILMLALMNVETFLSVRSKNRVQNGGDAAVLAASRTQATLLNDIGRLNLEHLIVALTNDAVRCQEIPLEQRRLALLGPVEALADANRVAQKNNLPIHEDFSTILEQHLTDLGVLHLDAEYESYPGAMRDYMDAIRRVLDGGLAVGPDNLQFYQTWGAHILMTRNFYSAVAGKNWCWFHFNARDVLHDYNSYRDWAPLPQETNSWVNSEIFSLNLTVRKCAALDLFPKEDLEELLESWLGRDLPTNEIETATLLKDPEQEWFLYDESIWRTWHELRDLPMAGNVKPEYDIRGCAAITRCELDGYTWSAAAKPFGTPIERFVLPVFSDVRLVPLDSVGGENLCTADIEWVTHFRYHIEPYLLKGLPALQECWYCDQLRTWENDFFREQGIQWLKFHAGECVRGTGGPGGTGGTSHGH